MSLRAGRVEIVIHRLLELRGERGRFGVEHGARGVAAGRVAIALAIEPRLSQQHGFLHAGVVVAALDSACGYAALTLMPADMEVLTAEFKVNLLAPAAGERFLVRGEVLKAGKTVVVCRGDAFALDRDSPRLIAAMQASMMTVRGRDDVSD